MNRMASLLRRLADAERGSAAIEFALMSLFFFGIVITALDFGVYAQQKLKLGSATEQGAILAFNMRDTVNPTTVATYIKSAAGLTTTPTVTCNNNSTCVGASSRGTTDYRCINQTTGAIDTTAYAAGAACTGGGNAGYYMKIVASKTYNSIAVPDQWLGGTAMAQTVIVRLS